MPLDRRPPAQTDDEPAPRGPGGGNRGRAAGFLSPGPGATGGAGRASGRRLRAGATGRAGLAPGRRPVAGDPGLDGGARRPDPGPPLRLVDAVAAGPRAVNGDARHDTGRSTTTATTAIPAHGVAEHETVLGAASADRSADSVDVHADRRVIDADTDQPSLDETGPPLDALVHHQPNLHPIGGNAPRPGPADTGPALDALVHQRLLSSSEGSVPIDDVGLQALVRSEAPLLGAEAVAGVVARVRARIGGIGRLEPLLADPTVTDVLVNGPGPVWIERTGQLHRTDIVLDRAAIDLLIERVVTPLGLRADRSTPIVDARLPDGSRVHVVLPPLAVDGPSVTIRRFGAVAVPVSAFCSGSVADLLVAAVDARMNMVVTGATGAGKTTLLNALCQHLPAGERVVTVEDAAELRLPGDHVVRLETRPATPDGIAAVTLRDLVRAALRMRPDRIIAGEVRGAEALDMLQALNTGHDGSLSSCHANGPADALRRLETMALAAEADLPLAAIREQLAGAVDVVVHVGRGSAGRRQVVAVAEVVDDPASTRRARPLAVGADVVASPRRPPRRVSAPWPPAGGAAPEAS